MLLPVSSFLVLQSFRSSSIYFFLLFFQDCYFGIIFPDCHFKEVKVYSGLTYFCLWQMWTNVLPSLVAMEGFAEILMEATPASVPPRMLESSASYVRSRSLLWNWSKTDRKYKSFCYVLQAFYLCFTSGYVWWSIFFCPNKFGFFFNTHLHWSFWFWIVQDGCS